MRRPPRSEGTPSGTLPPEEQRSPLPRPKDVRRSHLATNFSCSQLGCPPTAWTNQGTVRVRTSTRCNGVSPPCGTTRTPYHRRRKLPGRLACDCRPETYPTWSGGRYLSQSYRTERHARVQESQTRSEEQPPASPRPPAKAAATVAPARPHTKPQAPQHSRTPAPNTQLA
jgi:hypothetical protein